MAVAIYLVAEAILLYESKQTSSQKVQVDNSGFIVTT